ncbi:MAG: serine/threonine protein kinase [Anaerolineae bacterium CG_4_9_14_3_um_filter_57_17]|nr:serine/threonine protein kinase [bacterium]NCT20348.1 serine/threonine protein kinase [bacterium]OIO87321.1 MAG: protein kinase [Anaerolineae bacterium CG2_30_57_67]PJB67021.1 MAG: serine/threonine protein kinase [Anaerolineae bacterium CG_4_9_14_3_um_filter_57_17]
MPLPLKSGEVLSERYVLQERIGQGGMGNIYLADDRVLAGRHCALKEVEHDRNLPKKILSEAREQFLREATVLARLDHPNLPKVSDFFSVGARDYLVMDFVPGKDLRTLMLEAKAHNTFLEERTVLDWAAQLCDALTYLHRQTPPIVHRDIKPSNLKLTPDGLLKLVDFGLVKVLAPDEETITIIQGQGTVLYTPLEQFGGSQNHTDVRSDIFAFGATLYHLLTNQPPADARQRFLHPEVLLPLRRINPAISMRTERAILWAIELHPDLRPDAIETLRQYLFGTKELPNRPLHTRPQRRPALEALLAPPENLLLAAGVALLFIGLIATLGH